MLEWREQKVKTRLDCKIYTYLEAAWCPCTRRAREKREIVSDKGRERKGNL